MVEKFNALLFARILLAIAGNKLSFDFLLLPLDIVNIVLGVHWLNTLEEFRLILNICPLSLFTKQKNVLRGASTGLKLVKAKTLANEGKLFMLSHVRRAVEVL